MVATYCCSSKWHATQIEQPELDGEMLPLRTIWGSSHFRSSRLVSLSLYRLPFPLATSNHGAHGGCVLRLKLASSDGSVTSSYFFLPPTSHPHYNETPQPPHPLLPPLLVPYTPPFGSSSFQSVHRRLPWRGNIVVCVCVFFFYWIKTATHIKWTNQWSF